MREIEFENEEYYHVYNRGVEKRRLFLNDFDFERFIESMYLFNDANYSHRPDPIHRISLLASSEVSEPDREPFVKIIAYCLMPNHYHLLIQQLRTSGISRFLHKLDKGYSRYFNLQNDRTGTLYEGRFKAVSVDSDEYLEHLPLYIHLNALDLARLPWRDGLLSDWKSAEQFLDNYRWSSHQAYLGQDQYLPIIDADTRDSFYMGAEDYLTHLKSWSGRELTSHLAKFSKNDVTG